VKQRCVCGKKFSRKKKYFERKLTDVTDEVVVDSSSSSSRTKSTT